MGPAFADHYIELNAAILFLAIVFIIWRKPKRSSFRLKFGKRGSRAPVVKPQEKAASVPRQRPEVLNIHFVFNGHTFDAYEVLDLPAGSTWDKVQKAHQFALANPGGRTKEILDGAILAIQKHLSAQKTGT